MLRGVKKESKISSFTLSRRGPAISHIFFAYDRFFFIRANLRELRGKKEIVEDYVFISGQVINFDKSVISFSPNTTP